MHHQAFSLTLHCDVTNLGSSWAQITIPINTPPSPGAFTIEPQVGTEMVTMFSLSAEFWDDMDVPLTYEFRYR